MLEIPNGKVIFKHKIGEGHYGTVHLGEVRYNSPNYSREYVAIKTLKSIRAPQLSDDFMREIQIMEVNKLCLVEFITKSILLSCLYYSL